MGSRAEWEVSRVVQGYFMFAYLLFLSDRGQS